VNEALGATTWYRSTQPADIFIGAQCVQ
jgi:hypothetical protein